MEDNVKNEAQKLISRLLAKKATDPEEQLNAQAQITFAQIALIAATAILGTCSKDGTNLYFEGRVGDGLYVCCEGDPSDNHRRHCWKVGG